MRKASIRKNHEVFEQSLTVIDQLAAQVVDGQIGTAVDQRDVLAEGIVLVVAGHWEAVVDDDFVDALNRDTTAYARNAGLELPKNLSRDICFGLLVGDRYLDFRNTGEIVGRAKRILVTANNPFDHLTSTVRKSIDQFYILRNYVAHRSERAYRAYRSLLQNDYHYERIVRPGVFLRGEGDSLGMPRVRLFLQRFREASVAIRQNAAF